VFISKALSIGLGLLRERRCRGGGSALFLRHGDCSYAPSISTKSGSYLWRITGNFSFVDNDAR
jgi:hypothetical protein